jgi:hypothetical protein
MLFRDGIHQILVGICSSPVVVVVRFRGRWLISVVGSKIQKNYHFQLYIYMNMTMKENFKTTSKSRTKV